VGESSGPVQAIVVLGYRNRRPRANAVNRWRVRAALRSVERGTETVLVLSGGPVGSEVPEARVMYVEPDVVRTTTTGDATPTATIAPEATE